VRAVALIAALALGLAASAEEPAPPDESAPEAIVVHGLRTGALDPIPAASTDVLFADDYTAEQKDLADVLAETEGVFVRRFGGAGDRAEVTIRGSTPSQVVVAIDGVRANSALTGGLDLTRACLPLLERVEVTRGAGSARLGSGAVGGTVNLVTRSAGDEPDTRAQFRGGAFGTYEGSALHAERVGSVDASVGYCGFTTEGDFDFVQPTERGDGVTASFEPERATRLNNDRVQHGGTVGLGRAVGPGTLRLTDYAVYSDGGEPGFDGANGPTAGQRTEARSRDLANLAQLRWQGAPPDPLGDDVELAAYHRYESTRFSDPIPRATFRDRIDTHARLETLGARAGDTWRFTPFEQALDARVQVDGAQDWLHASDFDPHERASGGALFEPTLHLFDERVLASGGARLDWADGFGSEVLWNGGLVLAPWPWLRARGQAGRAYRVPNFDELFHPDEGFIAGNPDLDPEDALNYDAGLELQLAELGPVSDLKLGATWFRREIDESIVWLLVGPDTIRPVNTGSATADGWELSGSLRVTRFVALSAQHTLVDSKRDANRRRLPGQPKNETFVRLQLGPDPVWKIVGEFSHVGEMLVSEGGSRRLPARDVWNASAALNVVEWPGLGLRRIVSELWLSARLNNIGDAAVRDSVAFPQPGRNASAAFEVRW
jgi:outer membrane cobalamin receptor